MMSRPVSALLPDGKRLHLQHGPIDLIVGADGHSDDVRAAYAAAGKRFETILDELVSELPVLRREIPANGLGLQGAIASTMERAVQPFWNDRVTPMAAVAGAVAKHVLQAMTNAAPLRRAYVNNGGDIAVHLTRGEKFSVASPCGKITVREDQDVGGIATSGWRGRSFSLGIADAVTVLARTAAEADVAATLIANKVDLPHSGKVRRQPACDIQPDSDLGCRLVTMDVDELTGFEIEEALARGAEFAASIIDRGIIAGVSLMLCGRILSLPEQQSMIAQPRANLVHAHA